MPSKTKIFQSKMNIWTEPVHTQKKPFIKPTFDQVSELFFDKGVREIVEAKKFYAYYETVGWQVGRKTMRSWRAAVAGWVLRMADFQTTIQHANSPQILMQIPKTSKILEEEAQIKRAYDAQRSKEA